VEGLRHTGSSRSSCHCDSSDSYSCRNRYSASSEDATDPVAGDLNIAAENATARCDAVAVSFAAAAPNCAAALSAGDTAIDVIPARAANQTAGGCSRCARVPIADGCCLRCADVHTDRALYCLRYAGARIAVAGAVVPTAAVDFLAGVAVPSVVAGRAAASVELPTVVCVVALVVAAQRAVAQCVAAQHGVAALASGA